jgi:hypothetical protein
MPISEKFEDMPKFGWKNEIVFDWVETTREGKIQVTQYKVLSSSFPCDKCKTTEFTFVRFMPSGIFWACWGCRRAKGVGNDDCQKLGTREISLVEAVKILDQTEQIPPMAIKNRMAEARRAIALGKTV